MTDPVTIGGLTPFASAQAGDLHEVERAGVSGSTSNQQIVDLARSTLQGSEVSIRAAPITGASSGTVDLSSVTAGLSVLLTGGAPVYNAAVACAATTNITLSGEQTIDGVLTSASRVLLTGQTAAKDNGIWVTAAGAWTRATDANVGLGYCDDQVSHGQNVKVTGGSTNAGTTWTLTTANPFVLGTNSLTYTKDGTAKAHNLTFTNPNQTVSITGFTGMTPGQLPFTTRFGGTMLLIHSAGFFLNNSGQNFLAKAGDRMLVIPTGADTCWAIVIAFNGVLTVLDKRTSDGSGERDIEFGDYTSGGVPGLRLSQSYSRRKLQVGGLILKDGDGDGSDIARSSVQADGTPWTGPTPLGSTYAWHPTVAFTKGPVDNTSYATGRPAQEYAFQLEEPTALTRGGGLAWGAAPVATTVAGQSVPFDGLYLLPSTPTANVGEGIGIVALGRASGKESGQTIGTFNYGTSGPGGTPDYTRIFNFSANWNWGQGIVKGNLTLPMSDEAAKFAGIAMRTMASPAEGLDWRYSTSLDEARLGTVTGDVYTARWGWQKAGGHLLPATTNAVDIGSSARRVRKFYGVDLDLSGSVVLGDAAADTVVINAKSITRPNAPAFSAIVNANVNDVTGDATAYTVIFGTELFDRGSDFNPATGLFTAPVPGLYQFNVAVQLGGVLSAHTDFYCSLITTSRTFAFNNGDLSPGAVGTGQVGMRLSQLALMAAGDTASVQAQVNGSTKVVDVIAGTNATYFSGYLVA